MAMKTHTVRPGDTLESISDAYYGSPDYDLVIFQANSQVIQNPNAVYPGQVIALPHIPIIKRWLDND